MGCLLHTFRQHRSFARRESAEQSPGLFKKGKGRPMEHWVRLPPGLPRCGRTWPASCTSSRRLCDGGVDRLLLGLSLSQKTWRQTGSLVRFSSGLRDFAGEDLGSSLRERNQLHEAVERATLQFRVPSLRDIPALMAAELPRFAVRRTSSASHNATWSLRACLRQAPAESKQGWGVEAARLPSEKLLLSHEGF